MRRHLSDAETCHYVRDISHKLVSGTLALLVFSLFMTPAGSIEAQPLSKGSDGPAIASPVSALPSTREEEPQSTLRNHSYESTVTSDSSSPTTDPEGVLSHSLNVASPKPTSSPTESPSTLTTPPPKASVTDANQSNTPNSANLPVFMRGKQRLSQEDIDDKKVGGYFTGLPIINFDMTKGFGFGARAYYYNNGPDNSPYFEYTPYRHALYLQGLATTGGWQYHKVDYDGLYIGNSPFRFRASAFYERNTEATYYGTGATAMGKLRWSGSNKSYSTMNALANDLQTIDENGVASTQYNRFDLLRPGMSASIERDFWEGRGRVLLGASVRHARIDTFDGKPIKGNNPVSGRDNVSAVQGSTLLSEDCASGKITGCNGGWDNLLRLAVSLDTRDFEPDPNRGVFIGVSSQLSTKAVGSTDTYGRVSMTLRGYYSPFPRLTDLVLAGRFAYQIQSKKTPFYSMSTLTFPEVDEEGLGGKRSLRGYQQNRFIGPVMSFANAEVRWMPIKFRTLKQHFGIGFVPFLDAGRVYDQVDFNFKKWRFGYGCGLRVAWNQATIVVADYGISREDAGFSLTFGHHF